MFCISCPHLDGLYEPCLIRKKYLQQAKSVYVQGKTKDGICSRNLLSVTESNLNLPTNGNSFRSQISLRLYVLDVVSLNSFINGVESLNTSLLLAVQRLAKTAENSSQESSTEGRDVVVNETSPGNVSFLPELRAKSAKVDDSQHIEFLRWQRSNFVLKTSWCCSC